MSNADTRAAIAAALSTVTDVTGYERRPRSFKSGDAWPLWRGAERGDASMYVNTWQVIVVLPVTEEKADEWADSHGYAIADALPLFVDSMVPSLLPAEGDGIPALLITGRVE